MDQLQHPRQKSSKGRTLSKLLTRKRADPYFPEYWKGLDQKIWRFGGARNSDLKQQNAISSPVLENILLYFVFAALCYGREKTRLELRLPSGAFNKAVLSPVRIESPLRSQSTGACHLKTRRNNSLPLLMK